MLIQIKEQVYRNIKSLLKRLIPISLLNKYREYIVTNRFRIFTAYDERIFMKHSGVLYQDSQLKSIAKIVLHYHVIEKGLTMPDMRLGFGKGQMMRLIDECLEFQRNFDNTNTQFLHAVGVISEYRRIHFEERFDLGSELQRRMDILLNQTEKVPFVEQVKTTRDSYFAYQNSSFEKFSKSRHSIRNFKGAIELEAIYKAIELAQNAPSSCNRQPSRVHVVTNKELIAGIFEVQNGNRGFGHMADKLLIVTADLSVYQSAEERNLAYVDGGMYAMNLLYALHFSNIGACTLNWSTSPSNDLRLRDLVAMPDSEVVILLIACGKVPEKLKYASSLRNDFKEITKIH